MTNMAAGSGNSLRITHSTFQNNWVQMSGLGGAVAVDGQSLLLQDVVFNRSEGSHGGAIWLTRVSNARLIQTTIRANSADMAGGGMGAELCVSVTLQDSEFSNNSASVGGALVAHSSSLSLQGVKFTENLAALVESASAADSEADYEEYGESEDGGGQEGGDNGGGAGDSGGGGKRRRQRRRRLQQDDQQQQEAAEAAESAPPAAAAATTTTTMQIVEFGSVVYVIGTAGAILLQRCAANITDCALTGNRAHMDGGAAVVQQPSYFQVVNVTFDRNVAEAGEGGGVVVRGVGIHKSPATFRSCRFSQNLALGRSGGALLLDSGLGPVNCSCQSCTFDSNNAADDGEAGGAVALQSPEAVEVSGCNIVNNTATGSSMMSSQLRAAAAAQAAARAGPHQRSGHAAKIDREAGLPSAWQLMFAVGSGSDSALSCSGNGA
eukprot:gene14573-14702_t